MKKMTNSISALSFLPSSVVLEMTYECNHQCLFCSCPWEQPHGIYNKGVELKCDEWKTLIDKLVSMGVCDFSYTGGEPLMNKNILDIIEYTSNLKVKFINDNLEQIEISPNQYLITNGQLLDESILLFLKKHEINLSISLPGILTYRHHTKNGNPEIVLNWLKKAKALGIHTTVNITVTKLNLFELYETISNAFIAGANTLLLNRFLPGGRGMLHLDKLSLDKKEILLMLQIANDVLKKANRFGSVGTELPICLIKENEYSNITVGTRCSAGIDFFVIGPEGRIRTCNHSPVQLEHFTQIEKVKQNVYWKKFIEKDYLPENCKYCNYTYCCDGGCREAAHVYTNSLYGDDPVFLNN